MDFFQFGIMAIFRQFHPKVSKLEFLSGPNLVSLKGIVSIFPSISIKIIILFSSIYNDYRLNLARMVFSRTVKLCFHIWLMSNLSKLLSTPFLRSITCFFRALTETFHLDYVATRWYRAPELIVKESTYDQSIDIWAVGCLLPEMLSGDALFPGESGNKNKKRKMFIQVHLFKHKEDFSSLISILSNSNFFLRRRPAVSSNVSMRTTAARFARLATSAPRVLWLPLPRETDNARGSFPNSTQPSS